jgi:hypothetical protein
LELDMNFDLSQSRALLERTPGVLRQLLEGLPDSWTRDDEGRDSWSPHEVVAHLINGERTDWIPRARLILSREPDVTFVPFDREGFFEEGRSTPLPELISLFARLRDENLEILDGWSLGDAELELTARHPGLGMVTMRQLLASWVVHDLGHIVQISRTMARRYTKDVGPWTEYLTVLASNK